MKIKSLVSVAAALAMLTSCSEKQPQAAAEGPKYQIMQLKSESRTISQSYPAILQGVYEVKLFPQVEGRIVQRHYQNGALVKKGQTLLSIDDTPYRLQVQSDEANVKAAEAALSSAKLQYDSQKKLFEKKIVSEYVMKTAENNYLSAQAQLAQAKSALSNSRTNLNHCQVVAPIAGYLKRGSDDIGLLVSPGMVSPMVTISDQSNIIARFSINEDLYAQMLREYKEGNTHNAGALTQVQLKLKDGTMYDKVGEFRAIEGMIDAQTGTVNCEVVYPNDDELLASGAAATVIFPCHFDNIIAIPQTACKRLQDKYLAYKVDAQGQAVGVVVDVQPTSDGKEYIVKDNALKAGDEILATGVDRIMEGQKVK